MTPSGYLALDCEDDGCCPPGGRPLRDLDATMVGAHMVLAGALVEDTRDDVARIDPASATARRNVARVAKRSRSRRAAALAGGPAALDLWRADGLAAWRTATRAGGPGIADPATLGRLLVALDDGRVRDAVLLALVPGTADLPERTLEAGARAARSSVPAETSNALGAILDNRRGVAPDAVLSAAGTAVLEAVVAHAAARSVAPALTLLAILAWWSGDGVRSGVLLGRALDADPTHRLALIVSDLLACGMGPGWVRRSA